MTHSTWGGAGAGAVITWLKDLAATGPPRTAATLEDSRAATFRLRAQCAAERIAAAAQGSPSRHQARELAAAINGHAWKGQSRQGTCAAAWSAGITRPVCLPISSCSPTNWRE